LVNIIKNNCDDIWDTINTTLPKTFNEMCETIKNELIAKHFYKIKIENTPPIIINTITDYFTNKNCIISNDKVILTISLKFN
jgi:hypothetical protein